jgi:hypothetical protein
MSSFNLIGDRTTNLLNSKQNKNLGGTMKNYLLSEQDIDEIYWTLELFILTVLEKLSEKN